MCEHLEALGTYYRQYPLTYYDVFAEYQRQYNEIMAKSAKMVEEWSADIKKQEETNPYYKILHPNNKQYEWVI